MTTPVSICSLALGHLAANAVSDHMQPTRLFTLACPQCHASIQPWCLYVKPSRLQCPSCKTALAITADSAQRVVKLGGLAFLVASFVGGLMIAINTAWLWPTILGLVIYELLISVIASSKLAILRPVSSSSDSAQNMFPQNSSSRQSWGRIAGILGMVACGLILLFAEYLPLGISLAALGFGCLLAVFAIWRARHR